MAMKRQMFPSLHPLQMQQMQQQKQYVSPSPTTSDFTLLSSRRNRIVFLKDTIVNSNNNYPENQQQRQINPAVQASEPAKMIWGQPIWLLFHTLAEKVDETKFHDIRKELLRIVYTISINLPCPTCAEHAKTYLDGVNFNVIQTKGDLKRFMFQFHNNVNERKGFPIFPMSELDNKYSKANTRNIIYNFLNSFNKKNKSIRLLADDLQRQRIIKMLNEWFNKYISLFSN